MVWHFDKARNAGNQMRITPHYRVKWLLTQSQMRCQERGNFMAIKRTSTKHYSDSKDTYH